MWEEQRNFHKKSNKWSGQSHDIGCGQRQLNFLFSRQVLYMASSTGVFHRSHRSRKSNNAYTLSLITIISVIMILSIILLTPRCISGWWSTEQAKGLGRCEARAAAAAALEAYRLTQHLQCYWRFSGEVEWVVGVSRLLFVYPRCHLLKHKPQEYTSTVALTLNTHTQLLKSQFAPDWRKVFDYESSSSPLPPAPLH